VAVAARRERERERERERGKDETRPYARVGNLGARYCAGGSVQNIKGMSAGDRVHGGLISPKAKGILRKTYKDTC